jgi:hypothetical protein
MLGISLMTLLAGMLLSLPAFLYFEFGAEYHFDYLRRAAARIWFYMSCTLLLFWVAGAVVLFFLKVDSWVGDPIMSSGAIPLLLGAAVILAPARFIRLPLFLEPPSGVAERSKFRQFVSAIRGVAKSVHNVLDLALRRRLGDTVESLLIEDLAECLAGEGEWKGQASGEYSIRMAYEFYKVHVYETTGIPSHLYSEVIHTQGKFPLMAKRVGRKMLRVQIKNPTLLGTGNPPWQGNERRARAGVEPPKRVDGGRIYDNDSAFHDHGKSSKKSKR